MDAERIQKVLDDDHRKAWMPRPEESWEAFVRRKAPPEPSWLQLVARAHYRRALTEALRRGERHDACSALLVPMWIANNEDETARDDEWSHRLVVWSEGERLLDLELASAEVFWARVDLVRTRGSFVGRSRAYSPEVGVERFGAFAVVDSLVRLTVDRVVGAGVVQATTAPKKAVPAFSMVAAPGLDLAQAPREIADVAAQIAEALTFINEDE